MKRLDGSRFELLTFDCYGTLIDWETGIAAALQSVCRAHDVVLSDGALLEHFGAIEHGVQEEQQRSYRDVLGVTTERMGQRLGFTTTPAEREAVAESVASWPAFPDTVSALRRLSERYKLAVLSNIDDDLFDSSSRRLEAEFDWVVTAEQLASYKPARAHFDEILRRSRLPKDRILHVAQSLFHDIAPASALGFTTVWVNRRKGVPGSGATPPTDARPDVEVPDLASVANLLLGP